MKSVHYSYAQTSAVDFERLMEGKVFDNPKNWKDLARLIEYLSGPDDLVMDFFAGSASTGHAVLALNESTDAHRRFVLVQLAEPVPEGSLAQARGYATIADVARDRLRRVGAGMNTDVGFRTLRADTTNMADFLRTAEDMAQASLSDFTDSVKPDRTDEDLLFQVLLDWGLDLSLTISPESIAGRVVFSVDDDALLACFDVDVTPAVVKGIAERHPLRAVFRDSGFADDAARINVEQIFRELSPATQVRAI